MSGLRLRWKGLVMSAAVVVAVTGATLATTTLLGVTFSGGGSQPVAGSLFGGGAGVTPENASRILNAPNPFPDVVATVNGEPIRGLTLAQNVEMARISYEQSGDSVPPVSRLARESLDSLIEVELFFQEAKRQGLWPTEVEAKEYALKIKEGVLNDPPGSPEREGNELLLSAQGISLDNFDSDPRVLEYAAATLASINLSRQIRDGLSAEEQRDSEAKLRAERSFRESLRAKAQIEIFIQ